MRSGTVLFKVLALGVALGTAVALSPALIGGHHWAFLVVVWAVTAVLLATYSTRRLVPLKYLVPGLLTLIIFVVYPIGLTAKTSLTNYGDGTRTSKSEAISSIVADSVKETPNSPRYTLSVGTTGSAVTGPFTFFLVDQHSGSLYSGTSEGLTTLTPSQATVTGGRITAVPGYTILSSTQVNAAGKTLARFTVPTPDGAIRQLGISEAYEGITTLRYDASRDTITDTTNGTVYHVTREGDRDYFVSSAGKRVSDQSWTADVGLANYRHIFTDPLISKDFLSIFLWTVLFAAISVLSTFFLGLLLAVTLNDERVRGQRIYRLLLIIPYAIPGFISLLVWSSFFNKDFGLLNDLTGLSVDWLGHEWTARLAVIIANLWMGFPYMFLVCTGALQSIPADMGEAAQLDGASGFQQLRRITLPLVLVSVAPLLVAAFAFNFNNYNAIQLLTQGGPFSADNPSAGGTDILISYTIRLAFGANGQQIGFASAVSVVLFVITGVLAVVQFRATRGFEEVH
jgi:arabinogalactan oligomer/maltooligosaccharide transport system permease protein